MSDDRTPGPTTPSDDVRVRRVADRARYDRTTVDAIVDECVIAHVGTVRDGSPVVIPMFCVRDGDSLLLHGAPASGVMRRGAGVEVCAELTTIDGLVLARSAFHHSMNYRSVVVIGIAEPITDRAEKSAALELFVEKLVPGRSAQLRPTTTKEEQATAVLRLPLDRASAKIRTGDPVDDDEDYAFPVWAGIVPMRTVYGEPCDDGRLTDGVSVPDNVVELVENRNGTGD